ncbi:hypothetical protein G6F62_013902 [Rhizopus arrhizus]|nr:hypothetical protein G6F62_013902 [Rhizopus arrhizus]
MPGMPMSVSITWNCRWPVSASSASASPAELAAETLAPCSSSMRRRYSSTSGWSSTASTCMPRSGYGSTITGSRIGPLITSRSGRRSASGMCCGSRTVKVAPWPWPSLAAVTVPPCSSTSCCTIARPRPRPP